MTPPDIQSPLISRVARIAPGVPDLIGYRIGDLPHDLGAGLAVAAVALPVGVAYAELAGFDPVIGLYSSLLPLVLYALFGTSRQLIVGPDAATCALIAAAAAPLAGGDSGVYIALSALLALFAGVLMVAASFLRLGAIADFLSRPILVGFLNGISIHIILGQTGKLLGYQVEGTGILGTAIDVVSKLGQTHLPTLGIAVLSFGVMALSARLLPRVPKALMAMVVAGAVTAALGLDTQGVKVLGAVPAGLPTIGLPAATWHISLDHIDEVFLSAAGIALIGFTSGMITARGFAARNRYDIDVDRELTALGSANIASALSQGFAITGADSRTAMNDAAGGRTRVAGLFAAGTVAVVLLFLTGPLQYVPTAALGAVLIMASLGLLDLQSLRHFWVLDRRELVFSLVATFGVIWVGAIQAVLLAVLLALLRFLQLSARPTVEVLGHRPGHPGFHSVTRHPDAVTTTGLVLFRFNGPIVFFNAAYFKRQALAAADREGPGLRWFVLDMLPLTHWDITGLETLKEFSDELSSRGVRLVAAARRGESFRWLKSRGLDDYADKSRHFPTLRAAYRAYRREYPGDSTDLRDPMSHAGCMSAGRQVDRKDASPD